MRPKLFFYVLISLLCVLLVGGGYGFVWARNELIAKKDELAKHQLDLAEQQKQTDQMAQLSRRYNDAKNKIGDIDKALPRSSQQSEILLQVQEAAAQTSVTLPSILFTGPPQPANPEINQATKVNDLYVVPISLKLTATFDQLTAFLTRLESLSRYNSVNVLSLSKTITNPNRLEVSMTLSAYFKP